MATVRVWDAIMGRGKTNRAIAMMNAAQGRYEASVFDDADAQEPPRFLYISPLLEEVARIRDACPALHFAEPERIGGRKLNGLNSLLEAGRNVASTHELFKRVNRETYRLLSEHRYTLIIDEALEGVTQYEISPQDLLMLRNEGLIAKGERNRVVWTDKAHKYGGRFDDVKELCLNANLVWADDTILMWELPIEFLAKFDEVYVLTYLFEGSLMSHYLRANSVRYDSYSIAPDSRLVGIEDADDTEAKAALRELVTIVIDPALNKVGARPEGKRRENPLSASWLGRKKKQDPQALGAIKRATERFYQNHARGGGAMWTTFKGTSGRLTGKGYRRGFTPVNLRATNQYRDRHNLAYLANIFMRPTLVRYLEDCGLTPDQEQYALSEMLQWIWRSRIRDDKPINVFVPSERMRQLLFDWLGGPATAARTTV
jgi:hypothetical protein